MSNSYSLHPIRVSSNKMENPSTIQILDGEGNICCSEVELLQAFQLNNPNHYSTRLLVVSVVGEMRAGKSRLCNELYFDGKEIFPTSNKARACTRGILAARRGNVVMMDTEGLLSAEKKGKGFVLFSRVISLSDVIIYNVESKVNKEDALQIRNASELYSMAFARAQTQGALTGPILVIYIQRPSKFLEPQTEDDIKELFPKKNFPTIQNGGTYQEVILIFDTGKISDFRNKLDVILKKKDVEHRNLGFIRDSTNIYQFIETAYTTFNRADNPEDISPEVLFRCMFPCTARCKICKKTCTGTRVQPHQHQNHNECSQRHLNFKMFCERCYRQNRKGTIHKSSRHWSQWASLGLKYLISGSDFICDNCGVIASDRILIFWRNPRQDRVGKDRCPNCLLTRDDSYTPKDQPCVHHIWQTRINHYDVVTSSLQLPSSKL